MAYVSAIKADSGLPLFTRASEGLPPLSFSANGSLFGITTYVSACRAIDRVGKCKTPAHQRLLPIRS